MFHIKLKEEISNLKRQKESNSEQVNTLKQEKTNLEGIIRELQSKIDGFIFPNRKYLVYFTEYKKGWTIALMKELLLPNTERTT